MQDAAKEVPAEYVPVHELGGWRLRARFFFFFFFFLRQSHAGVPGARNVAAL